MNYQTLILNTKSVREFQTKAVPNASLKTIQEYAKECKKLIPSIELDVRMMSNGEVYLPLNGVGGYQGHMIEAPSYLILLSEEHEKFVENGGFVGQELILKATELGVDSCWITFQDGELVKEKLNLVSKKKVVAVIALGYEQNKGRTQKSSIDDAYRLGLEDIVYLEKWGNGADAATLEERGVLEAFAYARLAPSAWNKQPWRFVLDGEKVILTVKNEEQMHTYEEKVAAGIIMLYFQAIVDATLFRLDWKLEKPEPSPTVPDDFEVIGYCQL